MLLVKKNSCFNILFIELKQEFFLFGSNLNLTDRITCGVAVNGGYFIVRASLYQSP